MSHTVALLSQNGLKRKTGPEGEVKLYFFLKTAQTLIQQIHSVNILKLCITH